MATDSVTTTAAEGAPDPAAPTRPTAPTGSDQAVAEQICTVLDGAWGDLRRRIRSDLQPSWVLGEPGGTVEEQRDRVLRQLQVLADHGYGRIGFPTSYGGELDYGASCVAFEMQAFGDLSLLVKLGVQFGLFGGAVSRLGTDRHHAAYLEDIMTGRLLGSFAMTEVGHGSNVQRIETTATYDARTGELVVHSPTPSSVKTYIGNAARDARMAVVFAQLITDAGPHGVHAVLVPVRDEQGGPLPGVVTGDNGYKAGLPGVDNGTFAFDQVRVPRENLLNAFGDIDEDGHYHSAIESENARFFTMLGTLVRGRVCVGGGAGSAAKKALAIAIRYGSQRRQFEAPGEEQEVVVLDYLAHQRKLLPRLAKSYALGLAQNQVTERLQELHGEGASGTTKDQEAQRELETRVAGLKAVTTWHALDTIQASREACGGAGYIAENQLGQMRADVDVFTTFEGDNTVLLQLVAKGLLTEYKELWGDLDGAALVGMVSKQVAEGVVERTTGRAGVQKLLDLAKGRDDESALDDRGWQLSMFEQRADHLLETVGKRLRRATKENAFELFNAAQDHVLLAARAHIDRIVLEAFAEAVEAMPQGSARELLDRVCSLYALSSIEEDKGWFIEHGRIGTARSRAVTAQVNQLCRDLRPHALTLVDAMGVPESLITAPIAALPDAPGGA
ncbi:acyl-CoA dehydrogenase [Luteipulveratus sp. YIM 133132]|uniref:acyl-CoA dehydrogenase family protein n=1 Tax=Luteipulveratus flavus TaxID=3031728 RepID=UPI0023AFCFF2|nr:acyl-CoA dehydrogenase [Luteipulveratus sp. YIM 133132]MDE9365165.1 acyl-CoA dehydrogenase [Luteipulveratus sp. YIM 133132]